jgi:hypothetical protein
MIRIAGQTREACDKASLESVFEIDPTPDQIAVRAAAIRAGWSDKQRQRRRVTKQTPFFLRAVSVKDWSASIASALSG